MDTIFPGHTYSELVLALPYSMDQVRNDPGIRRLVDAMVSDRWKGTQDGAHAFLNYLNVRQHDVEFMHAVRQAVLQTSAAYLTKSTAAKPAQAPSQILVANRPRFVSAITGARTHSQILSNMPAFNSTAANNIRTLASREPDTAANNLLDIVEAQDLWGEFVIALTHTGHKNLADLFSGSVTPGAAPNPAPLPRATSEPSIHGDDGEVFQLRRAPEDMHKFIMVSLAQGSNISVIPARKFPGGLRTAQIARDYLESVDTTNSSSNVYYGTKLGVYKRIYYTGSKNSKSRIVENARFDSDEEDEGVRADGRKKKPSTTTYTVRESAPRLKSTKVVRGGVTRIIQEDQGLPTLLIVARNPAGLYEPVIPGEDEPGLSTEQEAVDFAIKNKKFDKTSEYGVYVLGPSNVVEEEEVFLVRTSNVVEQRVRVPFDNKASARVTAVVGKPTAKGSAPKASALPIPEKEGGSDEEDMSDK